LNSLYLFKKRKVKIKFCLGSKLIMKNIIKTFHDYLAVPQSSDIHYHKDWKAFIFWSFFSILLWLFLGQVYFVYMLPINSSKFSKTTQALPLHIQVDDYLRNTKRKNGTASDVLVVVLLKRLWTKSQLQNRLIWKKVQALLETETESVFTFACFILLFENCIYISIKFQKIWQHWKFNKELFMIKKVPKWSKYKFFQIFDWLKDYNQKIQCHQELIRAIKTLWKLLQTLMCEFPNM